jgi:ribosomal protein S21
MIRVEVRKNPNETTASLVRRFSKRVQTAGILRSAKSRRYQERARSEYVKKKFALKRIERIKEIEHLKKIGKMHDLGPGGYQKSH